MRLSEAIRLGAMMKPQGFEYLLQGGHTCALGAAADACGLLETDLLLHHTLQGEARRRFPILRDFKDRWCPEGCAVSRVGVEGVILHLNDSHRWTRERIADWVETIEGWQREDDGVTDDRRCVVSVAALPE